MTKKTIGFIDEGEETTIKDCEFHGFDIGIYSKGKRLFSSGNKFFGKMKDIGFWRKYFWIPLLVTLIGVLLSHFLENMTENKDPLNLFNDKPPVKLENGTVNDPLGLFTK